jgi:hypothetical protein
MAPVDVNYSLKKDKMVQGTPHPSMLEYLAKPHDP